MNRFEFKGLVWNITEENNLWCATCCDRTKYDKAIFSSESEIHLALEIGFITKEIQSSLVDSDRIAEIRKEQLKETNITDLILAFGPEIKQLEMQIARAIPGQSDLTDKSGNKIALIRAIRTISGTKKDDFGDDVPFMGLLVAKRIVESYFHGCIIPNVY